MNRTFTCILCPNGCEIEAAVEEGRILSIGGNLCKKGADYVRQELTAPTRNIATSVEVSGGEMPLVSVRLTVPIPRERIFDVVAQIKTLSLAAPVDRGQVLLQNVLGLGSDVIATRTVKRAPDEEKA